MNKSLSLIRKEIMSWSVKKSVRQEDVAMSTGVSQSQVSKILSGRFKTISPNVKKVCQYANIQTSSKSDISLTQELKEALVDLWDGSAASERALVKTLKTMKVLIGKGCVEE